MSFALINIDIVLIFFLTPLWYFCGAKIYIVFELTQGHGQDGGGDLYEDQSGQEDEGIEDEEDWVGTETVCWAPKTWCFPLPLQVQRNLIMSPRLLEAFGGKLFNFNLPSPDTDPCSEEFDVPNSDRNSRYRYPKQ